MQEQKDKFKHEKYKNLGLWIQKLECMQTILLSENGLGKRIISWKLIYFVRKADVKRWIWDWLWHIKRKSIKHQRKVKIKKRKYK